MKIAPHYGSEEEVILDAYRSQGGFVIDADGSVDAVSDGVNMARGSRHLRVVHVFSEERAVVRIRSV